MDGLLIILNFHEIKNLLNDKLKESITTKMSRSNYDIENSLS